MLAYSYISERDIDLILVEELNCSSSFQKWFLNRINKSVGGIEWHGRKSIEAFHSISRENSKSGETDVEIHFLDKSEKKTILLLENKIDAEFQDGQPNRYNKEVKRVLADGLAEYCYSILIAPKNYLASASNINLFDTQLSYEELISYFKSRAKKHFKLNLELSKRHDHKKEMLIQAVDKQRRGYAPEIDKAVTAFWVAYYEYAKVHAPSLKLDPPSPKPSRSDFIFFKNALQRVYPLPKFMIKHKLRHALVDLEIQGWGEHYQEISISLADSLDSDMRFRRAAKSLAISIDVKAIDTFIPFEEQADLVAIGLNSAIRLQEWYRIRKNDILKSYNLLSDNTL